MWFTGLIIGHQTDNLTLFRFTPHPPNSMFLTAIDTDAREKRKWWLPTGYSLTVRMHFYVVCSWKSTSQGNYLGLDGHHHRPRWSMFVPSACLFMCYFLCRPHLLDSYMLENCQKSQIWNFRWSHCGLEQTSTQCKHGGSLTLMVIFQSYIRVVFPVKCFS